MNILIIGTSHSVSSCKRTPEPGMGTHEIMLEGRWQDLLGEHYGVDVFTLARSGVSIEDQIDKVHLYSQMNHEKRYDLAIVEGRTMQNSIGAPIQLDDSVDTTPCKEAYMHWTDEFKKLNGERSNPLNQINTLYSNHMLQKEYKNYGPWFVDYVDSYLQAVQVWSMNLALCTLLDAFCDKVLWYTYGGNEEDTTHPFNIMGYEFLKDYALFPMGPTFVGATLPLFRYLKYKDQRNYQCYCGHLNDLGHQRLFNDVLKPRLDELKVFG